MADAFAELEALPAVSIVEQGAPLNSRSVYVIHHYAYGKPAGRSITRGDEIAEWIRDLRGVGRRVAFGWVLRGQQPPPHFPAEEVGS